MFSIRYYLIKVIKHIKCRNISIYIVLFYQQIQYIKSDNLLIYRYIQSLNVQY